MWYVACYFSEQNLISVFSTINSSFHGLILICINVFDYVVGEDSLSDKYKYFLFSDFLYIFLQKFASEISISSFVCVMKM